MTAQPKVRIRCYETMGVPNTEATCETCGAKKTYYVTAAKREGYRDDMAAAEYWATQHVCPDPDAPEIVLV